MTKEEAKKMLKAKLECLKREISGTDFDCNNSNCDECPLCYEKGNMGEQKEALDMAIKALQESSCEDAVSRKDMYFKLTNGAYPNETTEQFIDRLVKELEDMPLVIPTQKWIPVSERLPKPYTYVNATCRSLVDDRANWVVETLYLPIPKENNERGYSDWGNIPMLNWHKAEVVAWMERKIPEPYKGENESEECRGCHYNDGEPHAECVLCDKVKPGH